MMDLPAGGSPRPSHLHGFPEAPAVGAVGPAGRFPIRSALLASHALLALTACAGSLANRGGVESTVGRATYRDIMTEVPETLQRYGYAIYRNREDGSNLYIETGWQERAPLEDEAEVGVEDARTRFIARARKSGPDVYTLRISAENQVRGALQSPGMTEESDARSWATIPATDMYKAYVDEITTEIQLKVDAGLRTHGRPIRSGGAAR